MKTSALNYDELATHACVSPRASLGRNVRVGAGTVIHDNVKIEDGTVIDEFCVIGQPVTKNISNRQLVIGPNSRIRSHTVLYEGSNFLGSIETGHHTMVRENTSAGKRLRIGSFCDIEGACTFGDYVSCHSYVHVGRHSQIGSFVWLYSLVTLTNDPLPPSWLEAPVTIEDGAVVCVNCTVLPGTILRKGAYAAAGTLVSGTIGPGEIVTGPNCEKVGHVTSLIHMETLTRHPWMGHHHDKYPESAFEDLKRLETEIKASRWGETKNG